MQVTPPGKWIVIEGPKGCGKTTAQDALIPLAKERRLGALGIAFTTEPSKDPKGIRARELAAQTPPPGREGDTLVIATMKAMTDDRSENMRSVRRHLARGWTVVQARTYISTAVYQGCLSSASMPTSMSRIIDAQAGLFGLPHAVLWFDAPHLNAQDLAQTLWNRLQGRQKPGEDSRQHSQASILELERQIEAYRKCKEYYEAFARRWASFRLVQPPLSAVIDCAASQEDMTKSVIALVQQLVLE